MLRRPWSLRWSPALPAARPPKGGRREWSAAVGQATGDAPDLPLASQDRRRGDVDLPPTAIAEVASDLHRQPSLAGAELREQLPAELRERQVHRDRASQRHT